MEMVFLQAFIIFNDRNMANRLRYSVLPPSIWQ